MDTKVIIKTGICETEINLNELNLSALLQSDYISLDGDEEKRITKKIFKTSSYGESCSVEIITE